MQVAAVVVTYNRLKLLKENINALLNQTVDCDIVIMDNASTDGTEVYIKGLNESKIKYYNTGSNLGGAGGFSRGVEIGETLGYDFLWIMDDDSIPERNALESLLSKAEHLDYNFSFLASLVYWTDGKIFPMNLPGFLYKNKMEAEVDLISKYKVMPIRVASFVGCFVNTKVSIRCGLPISEFFIYGDDLEYTIRLRKQAVAYLDLDSIIIHKAPSNKGADIATAENDRIDRFFYQSRNGIYIARKKGVTSVIKRLGSVIKRSARIVFGECEHKGKRLFVLYKGTLVGFFFNPKIKFSEIYTENED